MKSAEATAQQGLLQAASVGRLWLQVEEAHTGRGLSNVDFYCAA